MDIALRNGMRYVYTGNVRDPTGACTYCHRCGKILIGRMGYELSDWNITLQRGIAECAGCATPIAGQFDEQPGHWGSRRQPVRVLETQEPPATRGRATTAFKAAAGMSPFGSFLA